MYILLQVASKEAIVWSHLSVVYTMFSRNSLPFLSFPHHLLSSHAFASRNHQEHKWNAKHFAIYARILQRCLWKKARERNFFPEGPCHKRVAHGSWGSAAGVRHWTNQWEFQDPKMEVLYCTVPYKGIFSRDIPLHRPYTGLIDGRSLQLRFLKCPLNKVLSQRVYQLRHFMVWNVGSVIAFTSYAVGLSQSSSNYQNPRKDSK